MQECIRGCFLDSNSDIVKISEECRQNIESYWMKCQKILKNSLTTSYTFAMIPNVIIFK